MKAEILAVFLLLIGILSNGCSNHIPDHIANEILLGIQQGILYRMGYQQTEFLLFGGPGHKVFLGSLTAPKYAADSIFNEYGKYGSVYSDTSIWNPYCIYGSPHSNYSPWNPYALDPPVIVDRQGNFYGRFTINRYHPQRTQIPSIVDMLNLMELMYYQRWR